VINHHWLDPEVLEFFEEIPIPASNLGGWINLLENPPVRPLVGRHYARLSLGRQDSFIAVDRQLNHLPVAKPKRAVLIQALIGLLKKNGHMKEVEGSWPPECVVTPEAWCCILLLGEEILKYISFTRC